MKNCKPSNPFSYRFILCSVVLTFIFCFTHDTQAQVKIGRNATSVQSTSILELESDSLGLLLPRLSNIEAQSIVSDCDGNGALGLLIYNVDEGCIQSFDTQGFGSWRCLALKDSAWGLRGNTVQASHFIGSRNKENLNFGIDSVIRMRLRTFGALEFLENDQSILIGKGAGGMATSAYGNTVVGYESLNKATTGFDNSALGVATLNKTTTGYRNTALGTGAMVFNTTGYLNTAVGRYAMRSSISAHSNVALGASALERCSTGVLNVGLGVNSLFDADGASRNVGVGTSSLSSLVKGEYNVALGSYVMLSDSTGGYNSALGGKALFSNKTGSNNVSLGYESLYGVKGSGNVGLGFKAGYGETGSNKLYIDNSSTTTPLIYGDFANNDLTIYGDLSYTGSLTSLSDRRLKHKVRGLNHSLDRISHIQAYTYEFKVAAQQELQLPSTPQIGLIAQELESVYPELVEQHSSGYKSVNYTQLVPVLIGAINELHQKVLHLEQELRQVR